LEITWLTDHQPVKYYRNLTSIGSPRVLSVSPALSTGSTEKFVLAAEDARGYRAIKYVQTIINSSMNGSNACYISYERERNLLWLMSDSGSTAAGHGSPGSPDILENSRCMVNLLDSSVDFRRERLILQVAVGLKSGSPQRQTVFATAIGAGGVARWNALARWDAGTTKFSDDPWQLPDTPPTVSVEAISRDPAGGVELNAMILDVNGQRDISSGEIIINDIQTGQWGCYIRFDRTTRALLLMNDEGTGLAGIVGLGTPKEISNSYCTVHGGRSYMQEGKRDIRLSVFVSLSSKMAAKRTIYASARDQAGLRQNWKICSTLQ
jgi:hypothetical protein